MWISDFHPHPLVHNKDYKHYNNNNNKLYMSTCLLCYSLPDITNDVIAFLLRVKSDGCLTHTPKPAPQHQIRGPKNRSKQRQKKVTKRLLKKNKSNYISFGNQIYIARRYMKRRKTKKKRTRWIYRTVLMWSAFSRAVAICFTKTRPPDRCPSLRSSIKFWSFCGRSFSTMSCFGRGWCS